MCIRDSPTTGYTREKAAALVNEMSAAYGLDIAAAPEDIDIIYADAAHDYACLLYTSRCV